MFITNVEPLINIVMWNKHDYWPILRQFSTYPEIWTNPDLKLIHSLSLILILAKLLHPWYFLNLGLIQKKKIWLLTNIKEVFNISRDQTNPDLKLIHYWLKVSLILIPAMLLHSWYFLDLGLTQKLKIWHILPA